MKLLLTGSGGQLGHELTDLARTQEGNLVALPHGELDITDVTAVRRTLRANTDLTAVINAAAFTGVDLAEDERERAFAVNRDGAANLAAVCAELDIPLIHISTDYVFDGSKVEPYTEDDPPNPISVYGASKLAGEEAVRSSARRHLIIRTSWVFSRHGRNFVKTMLRLGGERAALCVVADQRGCPTAAADVAAALFHVSAQIQGPDFESWGTYNYCGTPPTTWYGFAEAVFREARRRRRLRVKTLKPIPADRYPARALRPRNSVLECSRIARVFGLEQPSWQRRLTETVARLTKPVT
ncbi:MAG: dTDP-4-dehydrorhamnose reductase [Gemmatimonadota bacterium]